LTRASRVRYYPSPSSPRCSVRRSKTVCDAVRSQLAMDASE
jgi:hypothetical protein